MLTEEGEILDGQKAGNPEDSSVLKVGYEEVKELRVFPYPTHVETDFQESRLCAFQARRRQVPLGVGDPFPILWGGDDGFAPISAHVSQWNDGPHVFV